MPTTRIDPVEQFLSQFKPHCGQPREYLLPKAILDAMPALRAQEGVDDPTVFVKFFSPDAQWTWYSTEAATVKDPAGRIVDVEFFGLVRGFEEEFGYFTLVELTSLRGALGLPVERDFFFKPCALSKARGQ